MMKTCSPATKKIKQESRAAEKHNMQCPVFKEDKIAFYDHAIAYYRKAVNLQDMNRMYDCKEAYLKSEILVQGLRLGIIKE